MRDTSKRYASLAEYIAASQLKKFVVAQELGISRYQMSALLYPGRYSVRVDAELIAKIAKLINQPETYVRKLYPVAA